MRVTVRCAVDHPAKTATAQRVGKDEWEIVVRNLADKMELVASGKIFDLVALIGKVMGDGEAKQSAEVRLGGPGDPAEDERQNPES